MSDKNPLEKAVEAHGRYLAKHSYSEENKAIALCAMHEAITVYRKNAPDPLIEKLGPVAIQALLEGKAAVVRIVDGQHSADFVRYLYNGPGPAGFCDMTIKECRLDTPPEEKS